MTYEYVDLFKEMGIIPEEPKKEEKKNQKSATKKLDNKSAAKQPEEKVKLPVTVYFGYLEPLTLKTDNFPGKIEITVKEAHEYLAKISADYPTGISTLQKGKGNVLYLIHKNAYKVEKASIHVSKDTKLILGGSIIDISSVKTSDECNIECKDLEKHFGGQFNEYGKVGFIHSAISGIIVPSFSFPLLTETIDFPVRVGIFGRQELIITEEEFLTFTNKLNPKKDASDEEDEDGEGDEDDEDDDVTLRQAAANSKAASTIKADKEIILAIVTEKFPDFAENHLELQWNKDAKLVIAKMVEKTVKTTSSAAPEEHFPTNAMLSLIYTKFQLTPEMFGGKDNVGKEELRKYVEKDRPEYSKDHTNITYDKGINYIVMVVTGSRKGIETACDDLTAMNMISSGEDVLFNWCKDGNLYRVEKTDVCCIMAPKPNPNKGTFKMLLPKVPKVMFNIADEVFKRIYGQYRTEAMMQLFWDKEKGEYFWYIPEQTVDPSECDVVRNTDFELSHTLIADFHSHGHYDAYFSHTDNEDEKGFRIYGVFGNFDRLNHTFKLRAGSGGCFVNLDISDFFLDTDESSIDEKKVLKDLCADADNRIRFTY